jgi:hypothetical protein
MMVVYACDIDLLCASRSPVVPLYKDFSIAPKDVFRRFRIIDFRYCRKFRKLFEWLVLRAFGESRCVMCWCISTGYSRGAGQIFTTQVLEIIMLSLIARFMRNFRIWFRCFRKFGNCVAGVSGICGGVGFKPIMTRPIFYRVVPL